MSRFQLKVVICDECKAAGRPHAKHDGELHDGMSAKTLTFPQECGCGVTLVGECAICGLDATSLGEAAKWNVDSKMRIVQSDGTEIERVVSICGNCVIGLVNHFGELAATGKLSRIVNALEPKIVQQKKIIAPGGMNVIPGKFRRGH